MCLNAHIKRERNMIDKIITFIILLPFIFAFSVAVEGLIFDRSPKEVINGIKDLFNL